MYILLIGINFRSNASLSCKITRIASMLNNTKCTLFKLSFYLFWQLYHKWTRCPNDFRATLYFSPSTCCIGKCHSRKSTCDVIPNVLKAILKRSSRARLRSPEIKFYITVGQHGYCEMQDCAEKLFNRETVLPVKLSCPRFSVSVPFSLSCRSILHDKAWSCRSIRYPFLLQKLHES